MQRHVVCPSSLVALHIDVASFQVLYNIGKVRADAGDEITGVLAYREAIRSVQWNTHKAIKFYLSLL